MDQFLSWSQSKQPELLTFLKKMVEIESPSGDEAGVLRFAELLEAELQDIARIKRIAAPGLGPHLLVDLSTPGRKQGQILGLAHSDTVHPLGTLAKFLAKFPWAEKDGRLFGPGVLDIKGGIAMFVFAMRALRELQIPVKKKVILQINSDEEIGSDSSRALTEKMALASDCVLVVEPGLGPQGKLKTARKGTGDYTVRVQGIASHAGVDFLGGASAILEMARQTERIAGFTNLDKGITVNPGVVRGGTRGNVIAAEAELLVDIRIERMRDFAALDRQFRKLKPVDPRCKITVEGGLNRPPMERSKGVVEKFKLARKLAAELGFELGEGMTGGGSDGNFTAALGIPTLDGLGCVGDGAHTLHEHIVVAELPRRTALLAKLIAAL